MQVVLRDGRSCGLPGSEGLGRDKFYSRTAEKRSSRKLTGYERMSGACFGPFREGIVSLLSNQDLLDGTATLMVLKFYLRDEGLRLC